MWYRSVNPAQLLLNIFVKPSNLWYTVETLYSTIYYSKCFIELNFDKSTQYVALLNSQKAPHTSPFRASYGVSFMSTSTEIDRVIKGFYCKWNQNQTTKLFLVSSCSCLCAIHWNGDLFHTMGLIWRHFLLYRKFLTNRFQLLISLGRVMHICVSRLTIIGSDNGLSPGRRQANIWTNAGILLFGPLGTNFSEILVGIQTFSFRKMHLKMLFAL